MSADNPNIVDFGAAAVSAVNPIVGAFIQQLMSNAATSSQNAYNSPANQMQRLKAAGLNPYAFQSQIAGSNVQTKPTQTANYQQMMSDMFDNVQKIANIKQANTAAAKTEEERKGVAIDNLFKEQTLADRVKQVYYSSVKANLDNELQRGKISYQQYANAIKRLDYEWQNSIQNTPIDSLFTSWKSGNISGMTPRQLSYLNMPFKNTALYPLTYGGMQYDVWRKRIAWKYENEYNMPWSSNDSTMKFIRMAENALYTATGKTFPQLIKDAADYFSNKDKRDKPWWKRKPTIKKTPPGPYSYPTIPGTSGPVMFSTPQF